MKTLLTLLSATLCLTATARETLYSESIGGYKWWCRIIHGGATAEICKGGLSPAISPLPTGTVDIPITIGGKPITRIGHYAFARCEGLTSMAIPDFITSIGKVRFAIAKT